MQQKQTYRVLAAVPRYCDLGNAVPATQHKCDMNISPPASPAPLPFFFFFFRVSDRLIKDYNLSSSEGQRIGLAISTLIFFQVTAKLQCVRPNKIISPICAAWNSRAWVRRCSGFALWLNPHLSVFRNWGKGEFHLLITGGLRRDRPGLS